MKTTTLLGVIFIATAFAGPAEAIYKCTTSKGVVYQDRPCTEGDESDVRLVIPTGGVAPKNLSNPDTGSQGGTARNDNRPGATKNNRPAVDDSPAMTKPSDKRAAESTSGTRSGEAAANANSDARKKDPQTPDNSSLALAAEQARKTDASAKYYSTEGFSAGGDTPAHMTCESANGEKRVFYLSNGKLTSI